jgi:hypothetical protein
VGVQTGVGRFANALFVALFLCPLFFLWFPGQKCCLWRSRGECHCHEIRH